MKHSRLVASAVSLAVLSGCALTTLMGYRVAPDYPDDTKVESLVLPGLSAPVTATFDAQGVPHLEAANTLDLLRAVGYVQGRQRFFQMDLMRRLARGRLSELTGEKPFATATTVEFDRTMRGWDIGGRADANFKHLTPEQLARLQAFTAGVNAAMGRHRPLEYRLLGLTPEPWLPTDSLAVGLMTVWSVTHNYQQEAVRLLLAMHVGVDRMEALYPADALPGGRTVPSTGPAAPLPPSVPPELRAVFEQPQPPASAPQAALAIESLIVSGGSNAWAVSGARTQSGKPMVSNDPHLSHFLPSFLWQVHLKSPGLDVIGATVPGVPFVLSGHNHRVAWGMTSAMADVVDLVIERPDPHAPGRVRHEGGDCALTTRDEVVRVREGSTLREVKATFRATCNGPLYNDLQPALFPPGAPLVAIRWRVTGLERSVDVLEALNRADSVQAFREIAAAMPSTWNVWTVGDVEGHIAAIPSGEVPVRPNHRGTFPVPGWVAQYEWTRFASGDELPFVVDPPEGIVAHANSQMHEPGSPGFERLHVDTAPRFRLDRIVDLARATPKHDVESFRRMLTDSHSLRGSEVAPQLIAALGDGAGLSDRAKAALALLRAWQFDTGGDSAAAAIFFTTYRFAVITAVEDELPAAALNFFLAQRYSTNTSDRWFASNEHVAWDDRRTPAVERRDAVVAQALERAVAQLSAAQGDVPAKWRWGALHWHRPVHAFGGNSALDGTVNLDRMEAPGELDSVWKSHFDMGNEKTPFKTVAGPVYRSIVDLADPAHAHWVLDTGSSGWPRSPHYGDQYEKWKQGELVPMLTSLDEIRAGSHGVLTLTP